MSSGNVRIELASEITDLLVRSLEANKVERNEAESLGNFVFDVLVDGLDLKTDSEIELTTMFVEMLRKENVQ